MIFCIFFGGGGGLRTFSSLKFLLWGWLGGLNDQANNCLIHFYKRRETLNTYITMAGVGSKAVIVTQPGTMPQVKEVGSDWTQNLCNCCGDCSICKQYFVLVLILNPILLLHVAAPCGVGHARHTAQGLPWDRVAACAAWHPASSLACPPSSSGSWSGRGSISR